MCSRSRCFCSRPAGFTPTGPVAPGKPVKVSFRIKLPSGKTLTAYNRGAGPHTGVHLIFVREDLSQIIHRHPPVGADGTVRQEVTFPAGGRWHTHEWLGAVLPGSTLTADASMQRQRMRAFIDAAVATFRTLMAER